MSYKVDGYHLMQVEQRDPTTVIRTVVAAFISDADAQEFKQYLEDLESKLQQAELEAFEASQGTDL